MELRDLYDKDRKFTGEKIYKGQNIPQGRQSINNNSYYDEINCYYWLF